MKTVSTQAAVGMPLAHDLTQIIPGQYKGARFKKGHIVTEEDVPVLLSMGKEHLYVLELGADDVHEDEAGQRIAQAAAGENIRLRAKGEGKVELLAACKGVLRVDRDKLLTLIEDDAVMFATIHGDQVVEEGQLLAGTRVIPLYVPEQTVQRAEHCQDVIRVEPMRHAHVGIVTTGSEIYHGRIEDKFGEILRRKFAALDCEVIGQIVSDDDEQMIADSIHRMIEQGADMIAVTGGMSVDPDDRTPAGIRRAGVEIVTYGAPVLPGAMFLLGYWNEVPVVGLPGCVMYHNASVFELVVPRLLAGERMDRQAIKRFAEGGLCRGCAPCTYPNCGFGK
ncbi:MAG: molybdopterin-binding protein [Eubacteriales bacterium]|nr:molybdopterin-binding protein [Eubacteriales bacterium]